MAIYVPGTRDRKNRPLSAHGERSTHVPLTLTSMVDMFTILAVFLLMNYSSTGEIIYIPKDVKLPKASQIKELKPAHIVTITMDSIVLDRDTVAKLSQVKAQKDWMIPGLRDKLVAALKQDAIKAKQDAALKRALPGAQKSEDKKDEDQNQKKVTVQADRDLDFLTMKKVMYTVTEAGAEEINFAVMKKEENAAPAPGGP